MLYSNSLLIKIGDWFGERPKRSFRDHLIKQLNLRSNKAENSLNSEMKARPRCGLSLSSHTDQCSIVFSNARRED